MLFRFSPLLTFCVWFDLARAMSRSRIESVQVIKLHCCTIFAQKELHVHKSHRSTAYMNYCAHCGGLRQIPSTGRRASMNE